MKNKIEQIHNSDLYGVIIETGAGAIITNKLMEIEHASNTVYYSIIPYSKEYSQYKYDYIGRSVSISFIKNSINKEGKEAFLNPKVNFILASSWQLNDNDNDKYIHGWVGIGFREGEIHYYHFSFDRKIAVTLTRVEIINKIGDQIINILIAKINNDIKIELLYGFILDQAFDTDLKVDYDLLLRTQENCFWDYPLVFSYEDVERYEDLMRNNENFIIQKGSFNPLHHGHVSLMEKTKEINTNATPVFLIATNTYDKGNISIKETIQRIENITSQAYQVIILKSIYFYDTFNILLYWSNNKKNFVFPVGSDTIQRIRNTDIDHCKKYNKRLDIYINDKIIKYKEHCKFIVYNREGYVLDLSLFNDYKGIFEINDNYKDCGISSTKIRNKEAKNKI